MNHRVARLFAAAFVIAAGTRLRDIRFSRTSPVSAGEVEIIVDGARQPLTRTTGAGTSSAEGTRYAIRLRNPYAVRVAVALSVDGLNTIDARETTATHARKWVLGPPARHNQRVADEPARGAPLRIYHRGPLVRSGPRQDGEPGGNLRCLLQGAGPREHARHVGRREGRRGQPAGAGAAREGGCSRPRPARGQTKSSPPPAWAAGPTTPSRRCGWTSKMHPRQGSNIRYEFRPQLVRLGILPPAQTADPLQRREQAPGFEPGFSPEPRRQR